MDRRFAVRYEELMADAEVKPEALEGVLERLTEFIQPFAASLGHAAQRDHLEEYVAGLVSNIKRKNIESIAYLHEQDRQPLQKFVGQNPWEWQPMISELARQIGTELGEADGVLVFDPSGVLKQGKASVGVARQWCGRGQGGQLPGRRVPGLRHAPGTRLGGYTALPARGVDQGQKAVQACRDSQGDSLSHPPSTGLGNASRTPRCVAAPVGDGG